MKSAYPDSFYDVLRAHDWDETRQRITAVTTKDVEAVLHKAARLSPDDFAVLLSPAAQPFLETMAQRSAQLTRKRFGHTIQLYAPLYLSNICHNVCTYCGFSAANQMERKILTPEEIEQEVRVLKEMHVDHVLLVTGEAHNKAGVTYLAKAMQQLRPHFSNISLEVQPLETGAYRDLRQYGLHAVMIYQETYHEANYLKYHLKGRKTNFQWRLETPDRLGQAGVHKIGLGALFGLEDWRTDAFFCGLHMDYLERRYWRSKYSISFPRLRPHSGPMQPRVEMTQRDLVQLICAWRLFKEEVELSLSTRESERFRNHAAGLGVTTMSAASRTTPGGYSQDESTLEQFEISDDRSMEAITAMLVERGIQPVWKDWDVSYDCKQT